MDWRKDNKNAVKAESEKASSWLHVRVRQEDKARWVREAQKVGKLSQWVVMTLNDACNDSSPEKDPWIIPSEKS